MAPVLCIDSGNSRIKWGLASGNSWLARGALAHDAVAQLAQVLQDHPVPARVLIANVAGAPALAAIHAALAEMTLAQDSIVEVRAEAMRAGVRNGYREPGRLGVDRWCALIGARAQVAGPALVVMVGTATTVDTLTADGQFRGGLILPGIDLMRRSLARDTAGLPFADGQHQPWPQCTDDAIVTGILEAQAGAIERAWRRLDDPAAPCLLSGGAAGRLAGLLDVPVQAVEDLPLEGLRALAGEI